MKTTVRITVAVAILCAACSVVLMAPQAALSVMKAEPLQQSEAQKQLSEITKERDAAKRAGALENFIRDNPNSPVLPAAYSSLLTALMSSNQGKALKLADEVLAKYTDPKASVRSTAYSIKFSVLKSQKKEDELKKLGLNLLESATDPSLLRMASQYDKADSVKLLEKAIAERQKDSNPTTPPTVEDLRWMYAQSLGQAGQKDEALRLSLEAIEASRRNIAETEALPQDNPQRRRLDSMRRSLASRCQTISKLMSDKGQYQKALEYLDLSAQGSGDDALEGRASLELRKADIYEKMGKPDLRMESYARAFAARMDMRTHKKIVELAKKTGTNENKIFERARDIRKENAVAIKPFELKTIEGPVATLDSVKSRVTLVNFFFPT